MSRYRLTPGAREDLKAIRRYIIKDSPAAAGRVREILFGKFRLLGSHPLLGQRRDDLGEGLRVLSAGNYVIVYRPREGGIDVARVIHAARDIAALFRDVE